MFVNFLTQTFKSESELELAGLRWTALKDKYLPILYAKGMTRSASMRVENKQGKFQMAYIYEYESVAAMKECLPIWREIDDIETSSMPVIYNRYRGTIIDDDQRDS